MFFYIVCCITIESQQLFPQNIWPLCPVYLVGYQINWIISAGQWDNFFSIEQAKGSPEKNWNLLNFLEFIFILGQCAFSCALVSFWPFWKYPFAQKNVVRTQFYTIICSAKIFLIFIEFGILSPFFLNCNFFFFHVASNIFSFWL